MFILKDMTKSYEVYKLNDIKEIYNIVLDIEGGNNKRAQKAYEAACNMGFGGIYQVGRIRLERVCKPTDSISIV